MNMMPSLCRAAFVPSCVTEMVKMLSNQCKVDKLYDSRLGRERSRVQFPEQPLAQARSLVKTQPRTESLVTLVCWLSSQHRLH